MFRNVFHGITMSGESPSEAPSAVASLCTLLMGNQQMLSQTLQGLASAAESQLESQSSLLGLIWGLGVIKVFPSNFLNQFLGLLLVSVSSTVRFYWRGIYLRLGPSASQVVTQQTAQELAKMLVEAWSKNPNGGTLTVGHHIPSEATPAPSHGGKAPENGNTDDGHVCEPNDVKEPGDGNAGEDRTAGDDSKAGDDGKARDDGNAGDDGKEGGDGKAGDDRKALGDGVTSSHALALPALPAAPPDLVSPTYVPDKEEEENKEKTPEHSGERQDEEPSLTDLETEPGYPDEPLTKKTIKQYTEGSLFFFEFFPHQEIGQGKGGLVLMKFSNFNILDVIASNQFTLKNPFNKIASVIIQTEIKSWSCMRRVWSHQSSSTLATAESLACAWKGFAKPKMRKWISPTWSSSSKPQMLTSWFWWEIFWRTRRTRRNAKCNWNLRRKWRTRTREQKNFSPLMAWERRASVSHWIESWFLKVHMYIYIYRVWLRIVASYLFMLCYDILCGGMFVGYHLWNLVLFDHL